MTMIRRIASALLLSVCMLGAAAAQTVSPGDTSPAPTAPALQEETPSGDRAPELLPSDQAPPPASGVPTSDTEAIPVEATTLPRDLSPWGMIVNADRVVQAVMVGLAFASVLTWTIWLVKTVEITAARIAARNALRQLESAHDLADAGDTFSGKRGPPARLVAAAIQETRLSSDLIGGQNADGIKERIAARLQRIEAAAGRRLMRGTGVLASIGATAPFVGLFGTVWGIMNAFIGISEAETTNLAIVAPGIAEALLATGFGLIAAIPAVVIYNLFARAIAGYRASLGDASAAVMLLASRDLDRKVVSTQAMAA